MDHSRCYQCDKLCQEKLAIERCTYLRRHRFDLEENSIYEQVCNRLAVLFGRKHGLAFEGWVGYFNPNKSAWNEGAGGIACFGDYTVPMEDIRTDLMMDADENEWIKYFDACMEEYQHAEEERRDPRNVNYRSWLKGARFGMDIPDSPYVKEQREKLKEEKERVEEARRSLMKAIQENTKF